jgi:preprotein translocase subunit SecE
VAGETRRQRRDARRAAGDTPAPQPAGAPQPAAAGGGGGSGDGAVAPQPEHRRGFVRESWAELNKVEWPNRAQVIQGTIVVILACAIVGAYLWGLDQIIRPFVRDILIG